MTYNIWDGGIGREELILQVLENAQPDVVLLQEVIYPQLVQKFAAILNMNLFIAEGNSKRHVALLSRLPILSSQSYHPLPLKHTLLDACIEWKRQSIQVLGVHLQAYYLFLFEWWRTMETKKILARVSQTSDFCIMAGDFNALAPMDKVNLNLLPYRLRLMIYLQGGHVFRNTINLINNQGFSDCYRTLHQSEDGFTLPTLTPHVRLDYIFAHKNSINYLKSCDVVTMPQTVHNASDHYPLVAEFDF